MKQGGVYETLNRLVARLSEEGLDYAVIGGMALAAHGYRRFTEDVDILMTPETLRLFKERYVGRGYVPAFSTASKSFRDTSTGVKIEVMTTGEYPGDGLPKPVVFPDPAQARVERDELWVLRLEKLIELKLASGMTAPHRGRDLIDVQELIGALDLPLDIGERLDGSVRAEYQRRWELAQQAKQDTHGRA